jgi:hypothetical protein
MEPARPGVVPRPLSVQSGAVRSRLVIGLLAALWWVQDGFGWTNGVARGLLQLYPGLR